MTYFRGGRNVTTFLGEECDVLQGFLGEKCDVLQDFLGEKCDVQGLPGGEGFLGGGGGNVNVTYFPGGGLSGLGEEWEYFKFLGEKCDVQDFRASWG